MKAQGMILLRRVPDRCFDCQFSRVIADGGLTETQCTLTQDWNEMGTCSRHIRCPIRLTPTKKVPVFDPNHCDIEKEKLIIHEIDGYNRCIDETFGETE